MKWRFLLLLPLLLSPIFITSAVSDSITKLVFTSEPITVAPNELSSQITVQLQNSLGASEETSETVDVLFTSSSATGEFLNSSGSTVTKTMSTGTANKNFYYRDSSAGTHTITIMATGRVSGFSVSTSQSIVVGNNTGSQVQGTSTSNSVTPVQIGGSSGGVWGSGEEETDDFSVSIGKNRTGLVGVPIYFTATLSPRSYEGEAEIIWSFGDGVGALGAASHHSFLFPGDYVVVARARVGSEFATARIIVRVQPLGVSISEVTPGSEGYILISNNSPTDAHLGNFSLNKSAQVFRLPQDFVIMQGASLRLSALVSGINPKGGDMVELRNPSGEVMSTYILDEPQVELTDTASISGEETNIDLQELQVSLALLEQTALAMKSVSKQVPLTISAKPADPVGQAREVEKLFEPKSATIVIERKQNFFAKFLAFPRLMIGNVVEAFR